eukprot:2757617-Karenia_brevis.AAC.1
MDNAHSTCLPASSGVPVPGPGPGRPLPSTATDPNTLEPRPAILGLPAAVSGIVRSPASVPGIGSHTA